MSCFEVEWRKLWTFILATVDFVNENTAIETPFHLFSEKSNFNITIACAAGIFIKAREWNERVGGGGEAFRSLRLEKERKRMLQELLFDTRNILPLELHALIKSENLKHVSRADNFTI